MAKETAGELEKPGMFAGIKPETVTDAERWLYAHGYHQHGDFSVKFKHGDQVDLRQVVADFAETHNAALIGRVHAWQKIAEDTVARTPTPPIIIENSARATAQSIERMLREQVKELAASTSPLQCGHWIVQMHIREVEALADQIRKEYQP